MGKPRFPALVSVLLPAYLATPSLGVAQPQESEPKNCIECHRVLADERLSGPTEDFTEDIHAVKGFGCVSCHGGDATAPGLSGMDPAKGFLGKPAPGEIPQLCGRCHSDAQFMKRYNPVLRVDQVAKYRTSMHGQRLTQFDDPKVATCVSCHSAHRIRPPSEPRSTVHPLRVAETCASCHADAEYMKSYSIPTDQWRNYQESIHWQTLSVQGDLSAPTCNDCHGSHGATPPGVSWVGSICGQCHAVMAEFFAQSVHSRIFTLIGEPGCAACHHNHDIKQVSDELLGLGEKAACGRCHVAGVGGGAAAVAMRSLIDSLRADFDLADAILVQAELAGMEVSQAQFELDGAQSALISARAAVHSFDVEAVKEEVEAGLEITAKAQARGQRAVEELRFRRVGLAVSVTIILVLIVGLVLKIRELERTTSSDP